MNTPNIRSRKLRKISFSGPGWHRSVALKLFHANLIALFVRFAMLLRFIVVVIGPIRSGKTLILDRATPSKVFSKRDEIIGFPIQIRPTLSVSELPEGKFSIDDVEIYDPDSLKTTIQNLRGRTLILSLRCESDLREFNLDHLLPARRRLILVLERAVNSS
jgi:hypothetical protein